MSQIGSYDASNMPEQIKGFYDKNKTSQDIFEAFLSVNFNVENSSDPVVIIKLGYPDQADKFVTFKDEQGRDYFVALPILEKALHRDIIAFIEEFFHITPIDIKGGWIIQKDGGLFLDGESIDYGEANKARLVELIKSQYPGIEVMYETLKDASENEKKHIYREYRGSLDRNDQRLFLDKVYNKEGVRMGFDKISGPFSIKRSECSYLIYTSENGSSFGFDTLFIGKLTEDGGDIKSYKVAISRGYMNSIDIVPLGDNILEIKYESNGEQISFTIDLLELKSDSTHYSNFEEMDYQFLDAYQHISDSGSVEPCTLFSKD